MKVHGFRKTIRSHKCRCRAVGVDRNLVMIDKASRRAVDDSATVGRVAFSFARASCLPFPDAELLRDMNRATEGNLEPLTGDDWLRLFADASWILEDVREMPYGAVPTRASSTATGRYWPTGSAACVTRAEFGIQI
ncbi:MAG: hypothetical protein A2X40_04950 [Elusimicrobia bacterium GWC2_65_9]|nr:MAG: hypothetical protein A2X37_07180 [Elusimicrobia bacterium GWA2_66_18]OGR70886.1 MAG: hypothetical protein A2X40_04950 [Elusimicrobia bacterium GWC2_65_9]